MSAVLPALACPSWPQRLRLVTRAVGDAVLPIVLAMVTGALILLLFGKNPAVFYTAVLDRALFSWMGFQEVLTRMAPLLLTCAGLIFCFRAGVWNLGSDGQFLVGAAVASAAAVPLAQTLPLGFALLLTCLVGFAVGVLWSLPPAFLKIRFGTNEIITTLMMSLLGARLAAYLVKGPFKDLNSTAPQTVTLPIEDRFPWLLDTKISSALILAVIVVLLGHLVMTRTAFGLRLRLVGANMRATVHSGEPVGFLVVMAFALGGGMAGMAGAVEITAIAGNLRADENPGYGLAMLPLVFLARFNGPATIGLTFIYAVLVVGARSAARRADVPQEFLLVLIALVLIFMGLTEWIRRARLNRQLARAD